MPFKLLLPELEEKIDSDFLKKQKTNYSTGSSSGIAGAVASMGLQRKDLFGTIYAVSL